MKRILVLSTVFCAGLLVGLALQGVPTAKGVTVTSEPGGWIRVDYPNGEISEYWWCTGYGWPFQFHCTEPRQVMFEKCLSWMESGDRRAVESVLRNCPRNAQGEPELMDPRSIPWALHLSNSPGWRALALAANLIPALGFMALGGVLCEHFTRRLLRKSQQDGDD